MSKRQLPVWSAVGRTACCFWCCSVLHCHTVTSPYRPQSLCQQHGHVPHRAAVRFQGAVCRIAAPGCLLVFTQDGHESCAASLPQCLRAPAGSVILRPGWVPALGTAQNFCQLHLGLIVKIFRPSLMPTAASTSARTAPTCKCWTSAWAPGMARLMTKTPRLRGR